MIIHDKDPLPLYGFLIWGALVIIILLNSLLGQYLAGWRGPQTSTASSTPRWSRSRGRGTGSSCQATLVGSDVDANASEKDNFVVGSAVGTGSGGGRDATGIRIPGSLTTFSFGFGQGGHSSDRVFITGTGVAAQHEDQERSRGGSGMTQLEQDLVGAYSDDWDHEDGKANMPVVSLVEDVDNIGQEGNETELEGEGVLRYG